MEYGSICEHVVQLYPPLFADKWMLVVYIFLATYFYFQSVNVMHTHAHTHLLLYIQTDLRRNE